MQNNNQQNIIDTLSAQVEAGKLALGESLHVNLNLRTTLLLLQKQVQELNAKLQTSEQKIVELSKPKEETVKGDKNAIDKK